MARSRHVGSSSSVAELRCLHAAHWKRLLSWAASCASAPPLTTTDAETAAYGDPLADWWQVSLPASMGVAGCGPLRRRNAARRKQSRGIAALTTTAPDRREYAAELDLPPAYSAHSITGDIREIAACPTPGKGTTGTAVRPRRNARRHRMALWPWRRERGSRGATPSSR